MNETRGKTKKSTPGSPGQALILIAIAFVVLLGFVGLTTDVGQLFIYMGHLRRATDAAALAAAAQFREGRTLTEMTAAAEQVMSLNGIDPARFTVTVQTCDTNPSDPRLCTTPRRKVVRVIGNLRVPMTFLSLVGVKDVDISTNSIGEAASLDVVLVIDISESMAWDTTVGGNKMIDPEYCNQHSDATQPKSPNECQPFTDVKRAAISFINRVLNKPPGQEEDRLAIITFANGWKGSTNDPNNNLGTAYRTSGWISDNGTAQNIVNNIKVFDPDPCYDAYGAVNQYYGPCRAYESYNPPTNYLWLDCLSCWDADGVPGSPDGEWSGLPTTNIGGGLLLAGNMFAQNAREESLWVVVLLTDGMANATFPDKSPPDNITKFNTYPMGYCPNATGDASDPSLFPLCQDHNVSTRHSNGSSHYDADDYARDMADFVGCMPVNWASGCPTSVDSTTGKTVSGQGAVIYAIGLGDGVLDVTNEAHGKPYGASLLRYIAAVGYDGDPNTDICPTPHTLNDYKTWCGNYYYAPQGPQLTKIFEDIASRIFTRLVH
jgi:Flp pilus assembly protein TadG